MDINNSTDNCLSTNQPKEKTTLKTGGNQRNDSTTTQTELDSTEKESANFPLDNSNQRKQSKPSQTPDSRTAEEIMEQYGLNDDDEEKNPQPIFMRIWLWILIVLTGYDTIVSMGSGVLFALNGVAFFSIIVMMINQRGGFYWYLGSLTLKALYFFILFTPYVSNNFVSTLTLGTIVPASVTYGIMLIPYKGISTWKRMYPGMDWENKKIIYSPILFILGIICYYYYYYGRITSIL